MANIAQFNIGQRGIEAASYDRPNHMALTDVMGELSWMARAGEMAPEWWSTARDTYLSKFWKGSNHLGLVIYNAQSKLAGIPFIIEPDDPSVVQHQNMAESLMELLKIGSENTQGIGHALEKFYEDLLTQDNGAFMEIIESPEVDNPKDRPLLGIPFGVIHRDSQRCMRTNNPEFPVLYQSPRDGKRYKLHWTRVIYMSQMPSPRTEMNGVGVCAVSRALDIAQTAVDVIRYKQEKLGSRPPNQIIVGKGVLASKIMEAIRMAEASMDNRGFRRYSRTIAIGSESPDIDLDIKNLHHDDQFDEKTTIQYAMYGIASAFGLDINEVWPVIGGSGSADSAKLQRLRARGKLPAQVTEALSHQFNTKFLPPYLNWKFDFRDDEEDQQRALIRDIRGRQRERDIGNGTFTIRTARQTMLQDGDVSRPLFNQMEWSSGRLEDGTPIYSLFFSGDEPFRTILDMGTDNPLDFSDVDMSEVMQRISAARSRAMTIMANTRSNPLREDVNKAWYALEWYEEQAVKWVGRLSLPGASGEAEQEEEQSGLPPEEEENSPEEQEDTQDEENEGSGRSSMGTERRPGMEKGLLNRYLPEWYKNLIGGN